MGLAAAAMAGTVVIPQQADAVTVTTLHVNNRSAFCSDTSGTAGSSATPFCTIQAAANAATAGDTVEIFGGAANAVVYPGDVTITHSGTAAAPITFESIGRYAGIGSLIGPNAVTISGASYVNLIGLSVGIVNISNSAHVSVTRSYTETVNVEKGSSAVSFERDGLSTMTIASGASNTELAASIIRGGPVWVSGATGTDIVNNSFEIEQHTGISVTGGATGTAIENNILFGDSAGVPEIVVDSASSAGTVEGYNLLGNNGSTSGSAYSWAGTGYTTLAAFQAASGQGTSDVLDNTFDDTTTSALPTAADPAAGTANSAAPGLPSTDYYGNAWAAHDRGAANLAEYSGATLITTVDQQSVEVTTDVAGLLLGSTGSMTFNWGDGTGTSTVYSNSGNTIFTDYSNLADLHQYTSVGTYTVTVTITDASGTKTYTTNLTTGGSTYVPVSPTRVLDTRQPIGVGTAGMIAAGHSVSFNVLKGVVGAPAASTITAVVLNVTVTQPVNGGFVSAYPDGTPVPKSSNLNFNKGETVPNLTTVMIGQDGNVDLYTDATTHLVADVEGYYVASTSGGGYHPISPLRLLDTRKGTGAPAQAVGPGKSVTLKVAGNGSIPATGVVAAAMNVTVTGPTTGGVIIAYPAGVTTPNVSNVNYAPGETVANMAVVKLGTNGEVEFTNSSKGTVQLIADISGYYTTSGGDAFVPMAPWRALDTRNGTGQESSLNYPVTADSFAAWFFGDEFEGTGYWDGSSKADAVVLNVTVTQPAVGGVLIAYPGGPVPITSNINFSAGETIPNMVMVQCDARTGGPGLYNASKGTTQLIADVFGYFS
jgi:hypothetical protein